MLRMKRFSKVSSVAKLQFGQCSLAPKKTLWCRLAHTETSTSGKSNVGKYAIGSLIFGFSSIVVYAKYDTDFRQWLKTNVYGSDELLKLLLLENKSEHEQPSSVKPKLVPPTNQFVLSDSKSTFSKHESEKPKVYQKVDKSLDKGFTDEKNILKLNFEKQSSNVGEIENETTRLFKEVSDSYSVALERLKYYYELANGTVNDISQKSNANLLEKLKKISIEKNELIQMAEVNAREAIKRLDQLQYLLDDAKTEITSEMKENIKNKIIKLKLDIRTLGNDFVTEKDNLLLYSKYNNQVINVRKQFSDELQKFFPQVRLEDKGMKLTEAELNSFVEYITQKLLFYQHEVFKLESIGEDQVNDVVNALKNGNSDAIDKVLGFQVDKNRRQHMNNFIKESFSSKAEVEAKFKQQLRMQTEVHIDHLKEAAALAEKEVERRVHSEYSEKAEIEELKYQEQVSRMTAVMHAINDALKEHSEKRYKLNDSVSLWTACQSLFAAITTDLNASKHELKPLQEIVNNIRKSGENHKIVKDLLDTIPEKVLTRGVYTEETLKDRFLSIEDKAFHMALVPDTNIKLFDLITSFVFTIFTFKTATSIPENELCNEPINVSELNNIDILQRARYYVERDNYYQALRYMNLLKGGAKVIADDWMTETRDYLATQQAARTLLAYASARLRSHEVDNNIPM